MKKRWWEKYIAVCFILIFCLGMYQMIIEDHWIQAVDKAQWGWNDKRPFAVCQNKRYLQSFSDFAGAVAFAKKYENSFVYYYKNQGVAWSNKNKLKRKVILNAPLIFQMPELPRGCEVTSLGMLLSYGGVKVDKMTLARQIKKDLTPYKEVNGKKYFGNPNVGFVGNMYTFKKKGYGVYHGPVKMVMEKYLPKQTIDMTGCEFKDLLFSLDRGIPVWVIANSCFRKLGEEHFEYYHTPSGRIKITLKEHSVLLTGYDQQYIYINNPLYYQKNQKISRENFKEAWEQMGRQAITYLPNP